MKEPHIGLGIQNQASTGPSCLLCAHCPPHPGHPLFLCAFSLSCSSQDCIILGFVCRAAGGGVGPAARHPPSLSSPSTPSWVILLLPPFSGPWHPRNPLPYPEAVSSLSTFSCSSESPRGYRLQRQREGGWDWDQHRLEAACPHLCSPLSGGQVLPPQGAPGCRQGMASRIWGQGQNFSPAKLKLVIIRIR